MKVLLYLLALDRMTVSSSVLRICATEVDMYVFLAGRINVQFCVHQAAAPAA